MEGEGYQSATYYSFIEFQLTFCNNGSPVIIAFLVGFAQTPPRLVFGWFGLINGWCFLAGVELN
jgi:hypothetical protein